MITGITSTETAMSMTLLRMEVLANNLANINSTAFKKDLLFQEMLDEVTDPAAPEGEGATFTYMVDFSDGPLQATGNTLDFALEGRGFFAVSTPEGTRYTRNGNFTIALDGTIVTQAGYPVQGVQGVLRVPDAHRTDRSSIVVSEEGEIALGTQSIGQLRIVDFPDLGLLTKTGQAMFAADPLTPVIDKGDLSTRVRQGYLEGSNVDGLREMIDMVDLVRTFEAEQKVVQAQDATTAQALEVGRL
jgi:flagellar basal-body rod protein FlgF